MTGPSERPDWYRDWFGEEYLALYPHRDQQEAEMAVDLVLRWAMPAGGRTLDLACGAGRHMLEFQARGLTVIGLDLSAPLLGEARSAGAGPLVRGDMRHLPFADGSFQLVANFFTSFGYFAEPEEDLGVLTEVRRVLQVGGAFALDFLNAQRVRDGLVPRDETVLDDRRVVQIRRLEGEGQIVAKDIHIYEADGATPAKSYHERVRLYSPDQLLDMLKRVGLRAQRTFGDYAGSEPSASSPRFIILGTTT